MPTNGPRSKVNTRTSLNLESDLAGLSAVIMLFVESAGSFAELGAFTQTEVLQDKLVAILEYSHYNDRSFIRDGPVARLEKNNDESVFFYPWLGAPDEGGRRSLDIDQAQDTVSRLLK